MALPLRCSLSLMTLPSEAPALLPPPMKNVPSLSIPAAALDKLLGKFFKGVDKQNDSILIFQIAYWSYLPLNRPVFLPLKALKRGSALKRVHVFLLSRQQASTQYQPVFNLFVQSAASNPPCKFYENATNHQKSDTNR